MAYQETTGNSPDDVIAKIATFAAAAGWTVVDNILAGSNRTLVLQKGGDYIQVWNTDTTNIFITGYIGYVAGTAYNLQAGYAGNYAQANVGAGPYTNVFMFSGSAPSDHVHVVIEMSGGVFRHLSFGMLDKLGTWTGGTYFDAATWVGNSSVSHNTWNSYNRALFDMRGESGTARYGCVRCDIPSDGRASTWAAVRNNASYAAWTGLYGGGGGGGGEGYLTSQFYNRNDPPFSGQITLGTIRVEIARVGGFLSVAGTFPNVRYLNMARFSPGQEITVGSDTWKVFPMARKGSGVSSQAYSQNHAYAFKKVP